MAQVADIVNVKDEELSALAIEKGLKPEEYETKEALAEALSPVVTPEEIEALPTVEAEDQDANEPEGDTPDDDSDSDQGEDADEPVDDGLVYVRLSRGYPLQQSHTRAGVTLYPGPEPVGYELTEEQVALLDSDRYVEIVDAEEVAKWRTHRAAVNGTSEVEPDPTHQRPVGTYDDVNTPVAQTPGRRYDTGVNGGSNGDEDNPDGAIQTERETRQAKVDNSIAKGDTQNASYNELKSSAAKLGIGPVVGVKKAVLQKAIKVATEEGVEAANKVVADSLKK